MNYSIDILWPVKSQMSALLAPASGYMDMYDWCESNAGPRKSFWDVSIIDRSSILRFEFNNKDVFTEFVLRFG